MTHSFQSGRNAPVNTGRRLFLKTITVAAASTALAACDSDSDSGAPAMTITTSPQRFPQSVASGDPSPTSLILWTRLGGIDAEPAGLRLQVATDEGFEQRVVDIDELPVRAEHDHCLRVKVTGLQPGTRYFYRFLFPAGEDRWEGSRIARSRTAPDPQADVPVRYAVAVCQDYIGRYYNVYEYLVQTEPELDFLLHIGDYIYETDGDPSYQTPDGTRGVTFSDPDSAILVGSGASAYRAANSVSNYRDLYRSYRSDPALQRVHERYPMIAIWDDHEYSDDCWGATGTYFDALADETDPPRRVRAEQVYYEYMPIDDPAVTLSQPLEKNPASLWPNNVLYRRFRYGRNLETVLLDYRSYRPDHLIPEDAFPGKVVMDEPALIDALGGQAPFEAIRDSFGPYLDTRDAPWNDYLAALVPTLAQGYIEAGYDPQRAPTKANADLQGHVAASVFNQLVDQYNGAVEAGQVPGGSRLPPVDAATLDRLPRGMAYLHLGKSAFFSDLGSRYAVVQPSFDLYAGYLQATGQYDQDPLGAEQRLFLENALASDARLINVVSTVSTAPLRWDLSRIADLPAAYRTVFKPNVDHWDGFPRGKHDLLRQLANRPGAFLTSGDIHASFVTHHRQTDLAMPVVDFTAPAISSGTFNNFVESAIQVIPGLDDRQRALARQLLVDDLDATLQASAPADAAIVFADTTHHGALVVEVRATDVRVDYLLIDQSEVGTDLAGDEALASRFTRRSFRFDPRAGNVEPV